MLELPSVQMNNGNVLHGKRIGELTEFVINKFSQEELSYDEAEIILNKVKAVMGEFAIIQSLERK